MTYYDLPIAIGCAFSFIILENTCALAIFRESIYFTNKTDYSLWETATYIFCRQAAVIYITVSVKEPAKDETRK